MAQLYDFVVAGLQARKGGWKDAADYAGVHRKTVERIASRSVPNPGVETMELLAEWVRKNPLRQRRITRQPSQ